MKAGSELQLAVTVFGDAPTLGDHVLHVELHDPAGQAIDCYTRNVLAPAGCCQIRIPLAINDRPGQWQARICDVLTGVSAERRIQVVGAPERKAIR